MLDPRRDSSRPGIRLQSRSEVPQRALVDRRVRIDEQHERRGSGPPAGVATDRETPVVLARDSCHGKAFDDGEAVVRRRVVDNDDADVG